MHGILVGKCHFVRVYWCYEVGYVKRYGLCCWYGCDSDVDTAEKKLVFFIMGL
jgi:hypothetical protein